MANGLAQGAQTGLALGQTFQAGRQRRRQAGITAQEQQLPLLIEGARRVNLLQDPQAKISLLNTMRGNFQRAGMSTGVIDQGIQQLQGGDLEGFQRSTDQLLVLGEQARGGFKPGALRTFEGLTAGLSEADIESAQRIQLGLDPRAVGTGTITTATTPGLTEKVAESGEIIKQREKFAERTGASRAKTIDSAFARIESIDKNVRNIDKAISAIDEGASTGAIESRFFPSIRTASIKLDQAQKEMGLDVVSSVTFGALSKGELDLSLNIALPTGLRPGPLKEWLLRKQAAQQKLRAYFAEQIDFLDQGGTVAGFLRSKRRQSTQQTGETGQPQAIFSRSLNREISEQDITDTLSANPGLTRDQLLQQLQVR